MTDEPRSRPLFRLRAALSTRPARVAGRLAVAAAAFALLPRAAGLGIRQALRDPDFVVAAFAALVFVLIDTLSYRPADVAARARDRYSKEALSMALAFILVVAPIEWQGGPPTLPLAPFGVVLATLLLVGGLGLYTAAIVALGERFTDRVDLVAGHRLETAGIYARVRHPGYLGILLLALGYTIAFGSVLGLLAGGAALYGALRLRIRVEDAALEEALGEPYRAWRARTGALWPRRRRAQPVPPVETP